LAARSRFSGLPGDWNAVLHFFVPFFAAVPFEGPIGSPFGMTWEGWPVLLRAFSWRQQEFFPPAFFPWSPSPYLAGVS